MEPLVDERNNPRVDDEKDPTEEIDGSAAMGRMEALVEELTEAWASFLRQVAVIDDTQAA